MYSKKHCLNSTEHIQGKNNVYVKNKLEMLPWRTEAFTENKLKIISVYVR